MSIKPTNQTAVLSPVASSTSSVTILAANSTSAAGDRRIVFNDSSANLYLAYSSSAASTTNFTTKLAAGAQVLIEDYSGPITGIWDAANGFARTTEW